MVSSRAVGDETRSLELSSRNTPLEKATVPWSYTVVVQCHGTKVAASSADRI
jgi:hypothetical protein